MKRIYSLLVALGVAGLCGLVTGSLEAQNVSVLSVVNLSLVLSVQSPSSDNGTVTVAGPPVQARLATKNLLATLAQDENAEGKWSGTAFPAGAQLAIDSASGHYEVVDKNRNLLVDVSDILTRGAGGSNNITSGKVNDSTELPAPTLKELGIITVSFNDTAISGGAQLKFYLQGLASASTTATAQDSSTGLYAVTGSGSFNGAGEGAFRGTPLVVTGTELTTIKGTVAQTAASQAGRSLSQEQGATAGR
jgi:hypothetical protein